MLKRLVLAFGLLLLPVGASADPGFIKYTAVNTTAAVVALNHPGLFYGVIAIAAQTTTVTCYDNASAASGQVIYTAAPSPSGSMASQGLTNAFSVLNGVTCQIATSIVSPGYLILTNQV
jgi:hypothetical protein